MGDGVGRQSAHDRFHGRHGPVCGTAPSAVQLVRGRPPGRADARGVALKRSVEEAATAKECRR
ncbi:hypothetical protein [Streptomyces poriticola]|uniref:hypothetical protein n=1 Tax=Streptomyces poriticola TaxID=3120506 RepID=UPI002FCDE3FA